MTRSDSHPFHGKCVGGPFDGKHLIYHAPTLPVALDAVSGRALVAQVGPSVAHPKIVWKAYEWRYDLQKWVWDDTVRQASETAKQV